MDMILIAGFVVFFVFVEFLFLKARKSIDQKTIDVLEDSYEELYDQAEKISFGFGYPPPAPESSEVNSLEQDGRYKKDFKDKTSKPRLISDELAKDRPASWGENSIKN